MSPLNWKIIITHTHRRDDGNTVKNTHWEATWRASCQHSLRRGCRAFQCSRWCGRCWGCRASTAVGTWWLSAAWLTPGCSSASGRSNSCRTVRWHTTDQGTGAERETNNIFHSFYCSCLWFTATTRNNRIFIGFGWSKYGWDMFI